MKASSSCSGQPVARADICTGFGNQPSRAPRQIASRLRPTFCSVAGRRRMRFVLAVMLSSAWSKCTRVEARCCRVGVCQSIEPHMKYNAHNWRSRAYSRTLRPKAPYCEWPNERCRSIWGYLWGYADLSDRRNAIISPERLRASIPTLASTLSPLVWADALVAKSVDATDLKSVDRKVVPVRVRPGAQNSREEYFLTN